MRLRQYQWDAIVSIWEYFNSHGTGNPLVAMPTGTGKSVVIGGFIRSILEQFPNQRIVVATHVKELVQQNYEKLVAMWPTAPVGVYSAGLNRRDKFHNVLFVGIGSVAKRAHELGHVDLLLIDEAHLLSPNQDTMYQKFITGLKERNPYLRVIGLTATPWRLGHGSITEGGLFDGLCYDITSMGEFNKLIAEGYLAPLIPKRTGMMLDVDGVHMRGGEFIAKELQNAVDRDDITERALREAMELGHDRRAWLIFASGVEHAIHVADALNAMGIPTGVVHSGNQTHKMTDKERDETILDFKAGKLRAVVNNNVLTTGFDHPDVDMIVVLRPTASVVLWVQMLGRGTRPVYAPGFDLSTAEGRVSAMAAGPKQNCLVLDFAANTKRLGPINDPLVPRKKGKKGGDAPVRECEQCSTYNHASARFCICCGYEFPRQTKLKQGASTDEIIKGDLPVVERFKVDHVTYAKHTKVGGLPSLKVTYYCGYKMFTDYVCVEHEQGGFAQRKAAKWWRARTSVGVPNSVDNALALTGHLAVATNLSVWVNKQYPEILDYCFDGSNFGTQEAGTDAAPDVDNIAVPDTKPSAASSTPGPEALDFEDDIPF